ncbi:phage head-tail connector protein [Croceicoccus sp. YJ47]|uniref:head-tail connector protein n=1 Tax=Croceicoccus sp. YJ47 TaxID=2798724 RepID=UPI001922E8EB|nr:phage head-tail connector protein [Croceicoccus sp. YJ47]QQN73949.1 phage head-tail connector protein [Croceicoccus sp. YJ47]
MALPVSLDEAKRQLRVIGDDENDTIADFIKDAAGWVEEYTGHLLEPREVRERFSSFERLQLRHWPISNETVIVTVSGTVLADARLLSAVRPARLLPAADAAWPRLNGGDVVEVTYIAGYSTPADVPRNFVRAMLVLIGGYDADREGGEVFQAAEETAKRLCRTKKAWVA